ncbi:MAG: hypothetical protein GF307_04935 [candidate division Zixibacteria bacterium]|nr:hypothetical protein [candidate division Zixibacteria bacterium]
MSQSNSYKNLILLLGTVTLIFAGFLAVRAFLINYDDTNNSGAARLNAGIDSTIINTIDELEKRFEEKQDLVFYVKADPLRLSRVIRDTTLPEFADKFREREEEHLIRLSATIITYDDEPKAVIKFRDKSHIVKVGDTLGDRYKILEIERKRVRLSDGNREFELVTAPANTSGEPPPSTDGERYSASEPEITPPAEY